MTHTFQLAHLIDTLSWGGAQKLLVTFAEESRKRHFLPTVISLRPKNDSPFEDELRALGVRVLTFPCKRIVAPYQLQALARFLRRERFDVLHTHLIEANIVGGLLGRLVGTPVVSSVHNTHARARRGSQSRQWLEAQVLRLCAARVIAVGHVVAEAQRERLAGSRMLTIPNAVSIVPRLPAAERQALRRELVGDPGRALIMSVGRLTAQKGYADLIAAFSSIAAQYPQATLVIVGRGDLQEQLAALVESSGMRERILLLGARTDVARLLAAADIYASASHWEGLPIAVLEAMSARLPVVATDVGDVGRVVAPGTGIVVPAQQPALLAEALRQILDNPAQMEAYGQQAYEHVVRVYGPSVWLDQLMAVYVEACPSLQVKLQTSVRPS
jgi:glycosyltransferase involved in cell wall biosynthesis